MYTVAVDILTIKLLYLLNKQLVKKSVENFDAKLIIFYCTVMQMLAMHTATSIQCNEDMFAK